MLFLFCFDWLEFNKEQVWQNCVFQMRNKMKFTDLFALMRIIKTMVFGIITGHFSFRFGKVKEKAKTMTSQMYAISRAIRSLLAHPEFTVYRFRLISWPVDIISEIVIYFQMDCYAEVELGREDTGNMHYVAIRSGNKTSYYFQSEHITPSPSCHWNIPNIVLEMGHEMYWSDSEFNVHASPNRAKFSCKVLTPKSKSIPQVKKWLFYCPGGAFMHHNVHLLPRLNKMFPDHGICFVKYSLLPEAQYPQPVVDTLDAYHFMTEILNINHADIAIISDSAGGNIVLDFLIAARQNKLKLPSCCVFISPWSDLSFSGQSLLDHQHIDYLDRDLRAQELLSFYCGIDFKHPEAALTLAHPHFSPVYADLSHFPPILIHSGSHEGLLNDNELLYQNLLNHGNHVTMTIFPNMVHIFQCYPLKESKESLEQIVIFISQNTPVSLSISNVPN